MIIKLSIGFAFLIVIFFIIVVLRPGNFRVERTATVAASPDAVFGQVNDHHKFNLWNPFMKMDPNVTTTYSGPESGIGAACNWDGNNAIGAGSATIIESKPRELVRMRMDWKRPIEGTSTVDFTFTPQGGQTVVKWAMYGKNGFIGKLMSLFMNCDKMVGPQFEQGLANLGQVVAPLAAK